LGTYVPKFSKYESGKSTNEVVEFEYTKSAIDFRLEPTIAVIPFKSLIVNGSGNLYGELIANELVVKLSQTADLQVISLLSTLNLSVNENVIEQAKNELKADYVIFGTYMEAHGELRVSMQLTEVRSQVVTHASSVFVSLNDLALGVGNISDKLINEVRGSIIDREFKRAIVTHPLSLENFTLKLAALRLMHRISKDDLERSRQMLTVLCERNPEMAEPHALMGHWHILSHNQGLGTSETIIAKSAEECADRALQADDQCSLALTINAVVLTNFRQKYKEGEVLFKKAIESNPSNSLAWLLKGTMHTFMGEGGLAVAHTRKAQKLSPLDPQRYYYDSLLASAELVAGNYNQALAAIESSYKLNKHHASTLRVRTMLLAILGKQEAAAESAKELLTLMPEFTVSAYRKNLPVSQSGLADLCTTALADAGIPR